MFGPVPVGSWCGGVLTKQQLEHPKEGAPGPHPSPAPHWLCDTDKLLNLSVLPFLKSKVKVVPSALLSWGDMMKWPGVLGRKPSVNWCWRWEMVVTFCAKASVKGSPMLLGAGVKSVP